MIDKTAAPWLFRRDDLDNLARQLDAAHESRVRQLGRSEAESKAIRDKVRRDCLAVIDHNDAAEFSGKPEKVRRERDPAISDVDAVGGTRFVAEDRPSFRVITNTIDGQRWKGKIK